MKITRFLAPLAAVLILSGCAAGVTMMPRDSGKVYSGDVKGDGFGSGTMTVTIDGDTCTGPFQRVASGDSFGFVNTHGRGGTGSGTVVQSGDSAVKAIMSCKSGRGLRCDMTGGGGRGGGICLDDTGRVFDALVGPKS